MTNNRSYNNTETAFVKEKKGFLRETNGISFYTGKKTRGNPNFQKMIWYMQQIRGCAGFPCNEMEGVSGFCNKTQGVHKNNHAHLPIRCKYQYRNYGFVSVRLLRYNVFIKAGGRTNSR